MIQTRETGGGCWGLHSNIGLCIWTMQRGDRRIPEFVWSNAPTVKTKSINIMAMMMVVVMIVAIDGSSISWGRWLRNNLPLFHGLHQVLALGVPNKMDRAEARGEQPSALARLRGS